MKIRFTTTSWRKPARARLRQWRLWLRCQHLLTRPIRLIWSNGWLAWLWNLSELAALGSRLIPLPMVVYRILMRSRLSSLCAYQSQKGQWDPSDFIRSPLSCQSTPLSLAIFPKLCKIGPASFRRFIADRLPFPPFTVLTKIVDTLYQTSIEIVDLKRKELEAADSTQEGKDIITMLCRSFGLSPTLFELIIQSQWKPMRRPQRMTGWQTKKSWVKYRGWASLQSSLWADRFATGH